MAQQVSLGVAVNANEVTRGANVTSKGLKKMEANAKKTTREFNRMQKQLTKTGGSAKKFGGQLTRLVGGFSAFLALRGTIKVLASFEQNMRILEGITGATADTMERFTATARDLGSTTRFSATEASDGLIFLARAGFTANEAIAAIPATLNLAQVGMLDLGTAADLASNILTAFRLEAGQTERVVDVLVTTSNNANTDIRQLGEAMKFVAPVSASLGQSLEETAAALGVLGNAGIQAGMAGTNLRGIFLGLVNDTEKTRKALKGMQLSLSDVSPAAFSLGNILEKLAAGNLNVSKALAIFGRRNAAAALTLVIFREEVERLNQKSIEARSTAKDFAELMDNTLIGAFKGAVSAIQEVVLQTGESGLTGALRGALFLMTDVIRKMSGIAVSGRSSATAVSVLVIAFKTLGTVIGLLLVKKVALFFISAAAAVKVMIINTLALTGAMGLLQKSILGVAVLIAAFKFGTFIQDEFQIVQEASQLFVGSFMIVVEQIKFGWKSAVAVIKFTWTDVIGSMKLVFAGYLQTLSMGFGLIEKLGGKSFAKAFGISKVKDNLKFFAQEISKTVDTGALAKTLTKIKTDRDESVKRITDNTVAALTTIDNTFGKKGGKKVEDTAEQFRKLSEEMRKTLQEQEKLLAIQEKLDVGKAAVQSLTAALADERANLELNADQIEVNTRIAEFAAAAEAKFGGKTKESVAATMDFEAALKIMIARRKEIADDKDFQKNLDDGKDAIQRLNEEMEFQISIAGKVGVELETLTKKQEFAAIAAKTFGKDTAAAAEAVEGLLGKLKKLQAAQATAKAAAEKTAKALKEQKEAAQALKNVADTLGNSFANAFGALVTGAKSSREAIKDLIDELQKLILKKTILEPIAEGISGIITGTSGQKSTSAKDQVTGKVTGGILDSIIGFFKGDGGSKSGGTGGGGDAKDKVGQAGGGIFDSILDFFKGSEGQEKGKEAGGGIWDSILGFFDSGEGKAQGKKAGGSIFESIADFFGKDGGGAGLATGLASGAGALVGGTVGAKNQEKFTASQFDRIFKDLGSVIGFQNGGVVNAPTFFPITGSNRTGLAGEAGPEAILPLKRGAGGRLGVEAVGNATQVTNQVNISVNTPNADSFNRSKGQILRGIRQGLSREV